MKTEDLVRDVYARKPGKSMIGGKPGESIISVNSQDVAIPLGDAGSSSVLGASTTSLLVQYLLSTSSVLAQY